MKKQQLIFIFLSIFISVSSFAQVLISDKEDKEVLNSNSSAILQLNSSEKGFLMPRMTNSKREAIKAPAPGLQVYVTDFNDGKGAALFFNGKKWIVLTQQVTLPDPPTDVEATFTGVSVNSEVTVTFRAPENNGGSPITQYEVTTYPSTDEQNPIIITPIDNGPFTKKFSIDLNNFYNFRVTATNKLGTSIASEFSNVVPDPKIGDKLFGGRVFYILNSADPGHISGQTRGLICANRDHKSGSEEGSEEKWKWSPEKGKDEAHPEVTGTQKNMGHGKMNTQKIIDKLGTSDEDYAAYQATLYRADDGYTGWYLPSYHELNKIHDELNYPIYSMNFSAEKYWSSSEKGQPQAIFCNLLTDTWGGANKGFDYRVRPIRSF